MKQTDKMGLGEVGNLARAIKSPATMMVYEIGYAPKMGSC